MDNPSEDPRPNTDPATALSDPLNTPMPSTAYKVFFGTDGLRAGWGLLIFIALNVVLVLCVRAVLHKLSPSAPSVAANTEIPLRAMLASEIIPFLVILMITWIMSRIERRPNSAYGLGGAQPISRFFAGLASGVVCLSLLVLALWKTGWLVFDSRLLFGAAVWHYGALWLLGFLFVGLFEEYLVRGYLQFTLARALAGLYQWIFKTRYGAGLGFWTSALIFSILFGLGHGNNPNESPIGLFSAGLVGLVFCFSLWRTGSLWWAIGFHASWDWAQSFLYGVADSGVMVQHRLLATHPVGKPILSGGATGPEGSILILAIMVLMVLMIVFTLPRKQQNQA